MKPTKTEEKSRKKAAENGEPYYKAVVDEVLACPFCGEELIRDIYRLHSWRCSCSSWPYSYGDMEWSRIENDK